MPRLFNKSTDVVPTGAVYIGRPSKWGNPFIIGTDGDRQEVVAKFARWIGSRTDLIDEARRELRGKDLVCFCAPLPCHGDILRRIADGLPPSGLSDF